MSSRPHAVPPGLAGRIFTLDEARSHGLTTSQLSRGPYDRLTEGVWSHRARVPSPDPARELREVLSAVLRTRPEAMASHQTAGMLHELWLPRRAERLWPLHLTTTAAGLQLRGTRIAGHRQTSDRDLQVLADGLRATGPTRTVVDLAGLRERGRPLVSDDQLVAALDGIISAHHTGFRRGAPALRGLAAVRQDLEHLRGIRGVARVRTALDRCAPAVDSPLETRGRLCLQRHGLTGWVTDLEITVPGEGAFWPDLADPEHRLSLQFEGAVHERLDQRKRDVRRERLTEAAGWVEIRVTEDDLVEPMLPGAVPTIVSLVRTARRRSRASRAVAEPR